MPEQLLDDENSWMCNRCYRFNTSHESGEHCLSGCGNTIGQSHILSIGWKCINCDTKNSTPMFNLYKCRKCDYVLSSKDINKILYIP